MGRPIRIQYPGALYHITSRGSEHRNVFINNIDRKKFLEILADYHDRYGIILHCYVLMDNHYHLVMETPLANLVKIMHGINSGYTGYFNRKHDRAGHLLQGRYKAVLVEKNSYLLELTRYVHLNPVRAGIVKIPEEHIWSSYPGYISKSKQVEWIEYSRVLSQFAPDLKKAQKNYRDFVSPKMVEKTDNLFKGLYGKLVFGNEEFKEKIKKMLKNEDVGQEIVERKRLKSYPQPENILAAVADSFSVPKVSLIEKKARNNTARKVAVFLMKRYFGLGNREIGELFNGIHPSAVSKAVTRLKAEMSEDGKPAMAVEKIMSNVKT